MNANESNPKLGEWSSPTDLMDLDRLVLKMVHDYDESMRSMTFDGSDIMSEGLTNEQIAMRRVAILAAQWLNALSKTSLADPSMAGFVDE